VKPYVPRQIQEARNVVERARVEEKPPRLEDLDERPLLSLVVRAEEHLSEDPLYLPLEELEVATLHVLDDAVKQVKEG